MEHDEFYSRTTTAHLDGNSRPVGFYTMSIRSEPEDLFTGDTSLFSSLRARFTKRALLVMHLRWLAVHSDHQSVGIGTLMMGRVLDDFYQVTDRTGIAALTLTPIDRRSAEFYKDLGFVPYGVGDPSSMFLPFEIVVCARQASG